MAEKDVYNEYGLMPKEIDNYRRFCDRHRGCGNLKAREEMMEESVAPVYTIVILYMSTIGMGPSAKCEVCGVEESIICDERVELL